jgi:molybdopterin-binding protein
MQSRQDSGNIEIHIPRSFSAERPPLRFSHAQEDVRMVDHPVASQLPKSTGTLETYPSPRYFKPLNVGPGAPENFEDYLTCDEPQIALHVVNFVDGTLVSLLFTHTLTDLMGFSSLLKAWSLALAGKQEQIAPFLGIRDDPMAGLYNAEPSKPYLLEGKQLSGWRAIVWGFRLLFEAWWYPKVESRTIGLPDQLVMALRKKAKSDLVKSIGKGNGDSDVDVPFISDGDIIAAVVTKMACEDLKLTESSNRSVATVLTADARSRLPSLFRQDAAYVQNAAVGAFSLNSASKTLQTPLGLLALKLRGDLIAQLELDQMIWLCRLNRQSLLDTGNGIMFGDTSSVLAVVSNWSKIHCFDIVDFSPAITAPSTHVYANKSAKPGHPVFWHLQPLKSGTVSLTVFGVVGRDANGTMWLTGDLRPSTWALFKEYMNKVMLEGDSD